jgi:hypothetical protein
MTRIGIEQPTRTVEPIVVPVPTEQPETRPAEPQEVPERQLPIEVPEEEPVIEYR